MLSHLYAAQKHKKGKYFTPYQLLSLGVDLLFFGHGTGLFMALEGRVFLNSNESCPTVSEETDDEMWWDITTTQ